MKIWVCIPVFNRVEFTLKCLESLQRQTHRDFRMVVCDHGSTDGTSAAIREHFPDVILLEASSDLWWTGAINRCIRYVLEADDAAEDAVLTLNNDLEVDPGYLATLVSAAERYPDAIITSAGCDIRTRQVVAPGLRQSWITTKVSYVDRERDHLPGDPDVVEVTHAPGRGTLIPLAVFRRIGLYDERHLPHYGADYDFTFRARRAGYRILISYAAKVFSHVEATGMTVVRRSFGIQGLVRYLMDIKSPANLSARWWLAANNCPRLLLPSFIVLDMVFIVGSYFKFHLRRALVSSR